MTSSWNAASQLAGGAVLLSYYSAKLSAAAERRAERLCTRAVQLGGSMFQARLIFQVPLSAKGSSQL